MRELLVVLLACAAAACSHVVPHERLPPRLEYPAFSARPRTTLDFFDTVTIDER